MSKIIILTKPETDTSTITDIIESIGLIPIKSKDVAKGLNIIKESNPDCVMMDYELVENEDIDFISKIKSSKSMKAIPIILMFPENITEDIMLKSLNKGADEYIKYPIITIEVKTRLNIMLKLKESIDKVAREREFISTILDNTESFVMVTDFEFNVLRHNNYVSKFFSTPDNLLGKNFLELAFPNDEYRKSVEQTLRIFIESDSKIFHPEIILTKDNQLEQPFRWSITKERTPYRKRVLIFVGQDLSETRRYETMIESLLADSKLKNMQLEEANALLEIKNQELSELNQLKTEYISIASHDLRSPISQIMGLAQLLLRNKKYTPTPQQRNLIEKIVESAEFQLSLVSDILDITRVETGHMKLEQEHADINSLVEKSVASMEELTKNKGIEISVHGLYELRLVKIDSLKIQQVINNLVGNAVKFTNEGGSIEIKVSIDKGSLILSVKDTGIGIKADEIEQLFEKFGKTRKKGTMGEKGTGLGLSICKKLIELHKGEMGVESVYGEGSTFWFKIPVQ